MPITLARTAAVTTKGVQSSRIAPAQASTTVTHNVSFEGTRESTTTFVLAYVAVFATAAATAEPELPEISTLLPPRSFAMEASTTP